MNSTIKTLTPAQINAFVATLTAENIDGEKLTMTRVSPRCHEGRVGDVSLGKVTQYNQGWIQSIHPLADSLGYEKTPLMAIVKIALAGGYTDIFMTGVNLPTPEQIEANPELDPEVAEMLSIGGPDTSADNTTSAATSAEVLPTSEVNDVAAELLPSAEQVMGADLGEDPLAQLEAAAVASGTAAVETQAPTPTSSKKAPVGGPSWKNPDFKATVIFAPNLPTASAPTKAQAEAGVYVKRVDGVRTDGWSHTFYGPVKAGSREIAIQAARYYAAAHAGVTLEDAEAFVVTLDEEKIAEHKRLNNATFRALRTMPLYGWTGTADDLTEAVNRMLSGASAMVEVKAEAQPEPTTQN